MVRAKLAELVKVKRPGRRARVGCHALLHLLLRRGEPPVPMTPVTGAAPARSKQYEYRLVNKQDHELLAIYHDVNQRPERREGARLRLIWPWQQGLH